MTSTVEGSSCNGGRGSKVGKGEKVTRRTWSPREEASLITALKDLVANGWKSDNGFRDGYLTRLEDALAREFPGADIKGSPHITSKLHNWKRSYYSLSLMLSRSGVGWNANGDHTINCDEEQWAQIKKINSYLFLCDTNAKNIRHRSWPLYEDWQYIFGKDRATGDCAEDILDAVNNILQEEARAESEKPIEDDPVRMDDASVNDCGEHSSSHCEKPKSISTNQSKGKKRKANVDGLQTAVEMFCEITRDTNERLGMVASRVGYQYDVDQAKKEAWPMLENIPGLSLQEKFKVCDILTDQINRLLVFKGLSDDDRVQYVLHLLESNK